MKILFILLVVMVGIIGLGMWFRFNRLPRLPLKKPEKMLKPQEWSREEVTVGWVGHSTVLMQLYDNAFSPIPSWGNAWESPSNG